MSLQPLASMIPYLKNFRVTFERLVVSLTILIGFDSPAQAQSLTAGMRWRYLLLEDSRLVDDCPICGRPIVPEPLRGSFYLRLLESTPMATRYALEDIDFKATKPQTYTVKGSGTLQIGGAVAVTQEVTLSVEIDNGTERKLCEFTNSSAFITRAMPMLDVEVEQTNGTLAQTYTLRLAAAPLRDLWFSTTASFTAGAGENPGSQFHGGDLLSLSGRAVKRNRDLYTAVGASPPGPDSGLDAVNVLPGGEIAFSLDTGFPASNVGPLQHGDLLSTRGRMIYRNQELLAAFVIQPPAPDVGLDAVQIADTEEVFFSIKTDIFSEKLGSTLSRGDLLSSTGTIVRTNRSLLDAFQPSNTAIDYGMDSLYIWPGGEIWFSTGQNFTSQTLGAIAAGDLLSDRGYIVFRNAEFLSAFAPAQTSPDFGLDALYVVTDATPRPAPAQVQIMADRATNSIRLTWQSEGRVFQVERATSPAGPFEAVSPMIPDLSFQDTGALTARPRAFYRILQW